MSGNKGDKQTSLIWSKNWKAPAFYRVEREPLGVTPTHADGIAAMDLFVVPTSATGRTLGDVDSPEPVEQRGAGARGEYLQIAQALHFAIE